MGKQIKKTKVISKEKKENKEKNASASATSRQGRIKKDQTIKVFEVFSYLKEGVTLTSKIFEYIENNYLNNNVTREGDQYGIMVEKIIKLKKTAQQDALDAQQVKAEKAFECQSSFYNLLDYFLQSLKQLPKEDKSNEIKVGKEEWNKYLAQNGKRIPSNIMDMIIKKQFSNIQVFALMILQLYSMSNEDMAIDIILIFKACFTSSKLEQPNIDLIKIIQQYNTYFMEKIKFIESDLAKKQSDSFFNDDSSHKYRQSLMALLAYLSDFLMEQLEKK